MKICPVPDLQQLDGYNCGLFAIAFASVVLDGKSPGDANFDVAQMRKDVISCLENKHLLPFPKALMEEH